MENVLEGCAACKGNLIGVISLFPVSWPGTIFHHQECWEKLVWIIPQILYSCQLGLPGLAGHTYSTHIFHISCLSGAVQPCQVQTCCWAHLELLNNPHLEWACLLLALSSNFAVARTSGFTSSGWGSQIDLKGCWRASELPFQTRLLSAGCVLHKNSESQKSRWWQGRSVTSGTTASPSTSCSLIISCEICEGHVVRDNLTKCFLLSGLQLFAVTWNHTYVGHE